MITNVNNVFLKNFVFCTMERFYVILEMVCFQKINRYITLYQFMYISNINYLWNSMFWKFLKFGNRIFCIIII